MNIYLVVSEELRAAVYEDWFNNVGHWEEYRIAELVVARNHSQARWLAWQSDRDSFDGDVRDMPRMTCRLREKDVELEPGVILDSGKEQYAHLWGQPDEVIPVP